MIAGCCNVCASTYIVAWKVLFDHFIKKGLSEKKKNGPFSAHATTWSLATIVKQDLLISTTVLKIKAPITKG